MDRFDKFTDRARKVLTLAQAEAARFNHSYIGTEHLLLGLRARQDSDVGLPDLFRDEIRSSADSVARR